MKQSFGMGCPVLYHSILLYFILSMAIELSKYILLEFAPIMSAFCSLLLLSYFSKNYAGKIGTSLFCILPSMKKSMVIPYQKLFMSCYITFKKKTSICGSQVGHMWVTSRLFCCSVGQWVKWVGTSLLCLIFYLLCYATLLIKLLIMLKLSSRIKIVLSLLSLFIYKFA